MQPDATKLYAQISNGIFGPDDNECCYREPVVQKQTDSALNSNADAEPNRAGGQDDDGCHNSNGERTAIVVHVFERVIRGGRHGECLAELDSPKRGGLESPGKQDRTQLTYSEVDGRWGRRGAYYNREENEQGSIPSILKGFFFWIASSVGGWCRTWRSQQCNTKGGPDESFGDLTTCSLPAW